MVPARAAAVLVAPALGLAGVRAAAAESLGEPSQLPLVLCLSVEQRVDRLAEERLDLFL